MPRSAEQRAPAPDAGEDRPKRKQIDAHAKDLGIEMRRGSTKDRALGMRKVRVTENGKGRDVWVTKEHIQAAAETADQNFDRTVSAVMAGNEMDTPATRDILAAHKESILELAGKQADIGRAVYQVMEDAVEALKRYDATVEKAVADSGYTGSVAEGLRAALAESRTGLFAKSMAETLNPKAHARRTLESAMQAKALSEAANRINALRETVGREPKAAPKLRAVENASVDALEPRSIANMDLGESGFDTVRRFAEALAQAEGLNKKVTTLAKKTLSIEKSGAKIDKDEWEALVTEEEDARDAWAAAKRNAERIGRRMKETTGVSPESPEFGSRATRAELLKSLPEYTSGYRIAKPESIEIIDEDEEEAVDDKRPERVSLAPEPAEPAIADDDLTGDLVDDKPKAAPAPAQTGLMQRIASSGIGKWMKRGMLALGLLAGAEMTGRDRHNDAPPSRDNDAAMIENMNVMAAPEGAVTAAGDEMEVEQDDSILAETPAADNVDRIYPKGDPRNLQRALKILKDSGLKGRGELAKERLDNMRSALAILEDSGMPTKAEYQKMKLQERKEEMQAAMGRMEALREIGRMDTSPVLTAVKKAELKKKLDQHQAFMELVNGLDEIK